MPKLCAIGGGRTFNVGMRALGWLIVCGCNAVPVASSAVATTAPKPPAASEPKIFAVPDELMEFGVSLRGIHVGVVQTAIGRPGLIDGHRELIVKSRGKTDGFAALIGDLKWELESTIDLDTNVPLTSHEQAWVDFAGDKQHEDHTHGSDSRHDVHSGVGAVRGWHSVRGASTSVAIGVGGGSFYVTIADAGRTTVADRPAVRYDGTANEKFHFSLFISDDAARVPLAFTTESVLGTIAVELVDYQVPKD